MTAPALRRELTAAERHVDVVGLVLALEVAKRDLYREILREQRRAARSLADGRRARINLTPRMMRILERLYLRGVAAARSEAASIGVELRKTLEADPAGDAPPAPGTARPYVRLRVLLRSLTDRVSGVAAARHSLGADTRPEMLRALVRIPGALDAAGRVVSMTLTSGLSDVYQANAAAFSGWQYSAVLDGGTCDECEAHDGEEYATLDEALAVLPDFGPNPDCYGETRCRCRLVPLGAAA